jgi:hypothetical protein
MKRSHIDATWKQDAMQVFLRSRAFLYKWDGFRCLAFQDVDRVELQSKSRKLLTAYFPEVVDP